MKKYYSSFQKLKLGIILILIGSNICAQELTLKETLSYIEDLLITETKEELSIPKTMGPTNVKDYEVTIDYENIVVKTYLLNNEYFIKKARLMDATFSFKYSPEKYWKVADIYKPAFYVVYINEINLPPFAFLHKEDAERMIKALTHLKTFCKPDPFK